MKVFPFQSFSFTLNSYCYKFRVSLVHVCTLPELCLSCIFPVLDCTGAFHRPVSLVKNKNEKCWASCMQILDKPREKFILLHQ